MKWAFFHHTCKNLTTNHGLFVHVAHLLHTSVVRLLACVSLYAVFFYFSLCVSHISSAFYCDNRSQLKRTGNKKAHVIRIMHHAWLKLHVDVPFLSLSFSVFFISCIISVHLRKLFMCRTLARCAHTHRISWINHSSACVSVCARSYVIHEL